MKCWFCDSDIKENESYAHCSSPNCRQYTVRYSWLTIMNDQKVITSLNLWQIGFQHIILTKSYELKDYFITYDQMTHQMEVKERTTPPFNPNDESVGINYVWKNVLKMPFSSENNLILTPSNFKTRFPTLITFS